MGQGHHGGARIGPQLLERLVRPVLPHVDAGKAGIAGKGAARVDHGDVVARKARDRHQRLGDVHGTHHHEAKRRVEHLDEQRPVVGRERRALVAAKGIGDRIQGRRRHLAQDHLAVDHQRLALAAQPAQQRGLALGRARLEQPVEGFLSS